MQSMKKKKPKRRGLKLLILLGLLALLAFLLNSLFGLGLGLGVLGMDDPGEEGQGDGTETTQPLVTETPETRAPTPDRDPSAQAADKPPCELMLDAEGIHMDGRVVTQAEAVRACAAAGRVVLEDEDDALTGTFNELVRALKDAGVAGTPEPEEL